MDKRIFSTAQDAEAAFYEALERGDVEAMMAVWADDEETLCIHPGGDYLRGYEAVRGSWTKLFTDRPHARVSLSAQVQMEGMVLAVHNVHEHVAGAQASRATVLATNVYIRTPEGWRMLARHASYAPAEGEMGADSPSMLH